MARLIAIGDIHGCSVALDALLDVVNPRPQDTVVALGDCVDRGPDSRSVVDRLIELATRCQLITLLGNHEEMLLRARSSQETLNLWQECGGLATLRSYAEDASLEQIPAEHVAFLKSGRSVFETETHFFVHGNYLPQRALDQQPGEVLRWLSLRDHVPGPHLSGKIAVVGHTPQKEILNLGYLIDLDTGCCYGGWLSALDVDAGQVWQTNQAGEVRQAQLLPPAQGS